MTNTYVSLEQVSVTTRSGNFLWELKYYYLPNVANCTLKSDSLSTKNSVFFGEYGFTHSNSASSSAYLVNSMSGMTEKKKISPDISSVHFPCRQSLNRLVVEFTHWQRNSVKVVQNL